MHRHNTRRRRLFTVVAAVGLTGSLAVGCSDDDADTNDPASSTTAAPASTTDESTDESTDEQIMAINDVIDCEIVDGVGTARGELENSSTKTADFELEMGFKDAETGEELGTGTTSIDALPGGEVGEWEVVVEGLPDVEPTCGTLTLTPTAVE